MSTSLWHNRKVRHAEDELNLRHLQLGSWTAGNCRERTGTPQESPRSSAQLHPVSTSPSKTTGMKTTGMSTAKHLALLPTGMSVKSSMENWTAPPPRPTSLSKPLRHLQVRKSSVQGVASSSHQTPRQEPFDERSADTGGHSRTRLAGNLRTFFLGREVPKKIIEFHHLRCQAADSMKKRWNPGLGENP